MANSFCCILETNMSFPGGSDGKQLLAMQDTLVDLLEDEMATHSRILPGEFHGQRSLRVHRVSESQIQHCKATILQ